MRLSSLKLKECIKLQCDASAEKAFSLMEEKSLEYCLVTKEDGSILGYVSKNILGDQLSENGNIEDILLDKCACSFEFIYSIDSFLSDIPDSFQVPILVFDERTDSYNIIDFEVVFSSLEHLYQQKERLSEELDLILDFSHDEIYITDGKGVTLRVNKAFEENSGILVEKVLGRNVRDLENEGVFKPSIARMVLEEKRQVTTLQQYYDSDKRVLVTGTPVFNDDGSIFRVILNTRDTAKLNKLKSQLEEIDRLKESYYQELLEVSQAKVGNAVAYSSSMKKLLLTARKVAEVDTTVLFLGESGVGKSLLARYIHENSKRSSQPFITISCGAIPENLLESELFGYEAGAFTGAHPKGKIGKIELANKGTLFLDEIGDLPLMLQVKLLHVIQEGVLTRLGGNKEVKPDVRFITATNKDLLEMVKDGSFREDLYYRLNVVPLEIPPLRYRVDDIEPLTEMFIESSNKKYNKNKTISPNALACFKNYSWPGNVRELENLIERLVIVVNEEVIEVEHLPESIKMEYIAQDVSSRALANAATPLERVKRDLEKRILEKLYREHGNTYKLAQLLKINQSTVVRKLKKYNITK